MAADLYQPAEGARAGMILVPGVAPTGKDDRRLVAFANTIARAGFEVLVPDLARMRALQVSAADAPLLASAAQWMAQRDPDRPLGITAISFAGGPAVLALAEPEARGRIDFVLTVGGYYDLPAVITFFTTGAFRERESDDVALPHAECLRKMGVSAVERAEAGPAGGPGGARRHRQAQDGGSGGRRGRVS